MAHSLPKYTKIKDKYCICYFGPNEEYVKQLILVRPYLEEFLPGLRIYICCKDDISQKNEKIIPRSQIREKRREFGHIREIKHSLETKSNPVLELLLESNIPIPNGIFR